MYIMKKFSQSIVCTVLVLGLLVLPMQNVWAMADMPLCNMTMPTNNMSHMVMTDKVMAKVNGLSKGHAIDMSNGDEVCDKCSHLSSFVVMSGLLSLHSKGFFSFAFFNSDYLSYVEPLDLPPPMTA